MIFKRVPIIIVLAVLVYILYLQASLLKQTKEIKGIDECETQNKADSVYNIEIHLPKSCQR